MYNPKKSVLAVDIGESTIKVVELIQEGGQPRLLRFGEKALPPEAFQDKDNREAVKQACANVLSALLGEMNVPVSRVRHVYSTIPGDKVNLKQITTLALSDEELGSALAFEARKHVPIDGDWLMDHQVLTRKGDDLSVLLAVASKEAIQEHLDLLGRCGLSSPVIEAPALSIVNAFLLNPAIYRDAATLLFIHIGAGLTHVCLYRKDGLFFSRAVPVAGSRFTADIARQFKVSIREAEKIKLEKGADNAGPLDAANGGIQTIELLSATDAGQSALDELVREIHRSIRFYAKETGSGQVDLTVLSGGSALDSTIRKRIGEVVKCPIVAPDPLNGIQAVAGRPVPPASQFIQVMGTALRGFHELFSNQSK